jgi:hypothetical protein
MNKRILGWTGLAVAAAALGITCSGGNANQNEELDRAPIYATTYAAVGPGSGLDAALISSPFLGIFAPGERRLVSLTMGNLGTTPWSSTSFMLHWVPNTGFFGFSTQSVVPTVAPGQLATFGFPLVAPSTPGSYVFDAQMIFYSAVGGQFFGSRASIPFTVAGGAQPQLDAQLVSQQFPANPAPGTTFTATVVLQNTGSTTWSAGTGFLFYNRNNPVNTWGEVYVKSATVASGDNGIFLLKLKAPATLPASYLWQMYKVNTGFFGTLVNFPTAGGAGLHIVDATYGPNCGVPTNGPNPCNTAGFGCSTGVEPVGYALADIRLVCEGTSASPQCVYPPVPSVGVPATIVQRLGDPAVGCSKTYVAHYTCSGGPLKVLTVPAEANGSFVTFQCP